MDVIGIDFDFCGGIALAAQLRCIFGGGWAGCLGSVAAFDSPIDCSGDGPFMVLCYLVRNRILEEVRSEYVLLARSKGLAKKNVMFHHCLRAVLPSYLSIMAIAVPHVMGGTYIVETVFSYPGIGTLVYESARYKDYNLLMILSLLSGIVVICCNMAAQVINERIDPRISEEAGQ